MSLKTLKMLHDTNKLFKIIIKIYIYKLLIKSKFTINDQ